MSKKDKWIIRIMNLVEIVVAFMATVYVFLHTLSLTWALVVFFGISVVYLLCVIEYTKRRQSKSANSRKA